MEFKQAELGNGLTVIGEEMGEAQSLGVGLFVRRGARDEEAGISGTSHFLEHMVFKGTDKLSATEVNLAFDRMGAQYNAFTSEENTVYYAAVLPEFQGQVLALWAELMRPSLREEDFQTEKGVICEEIAMYKDMPHFEVVDQCRRRHFADHGCGNSVLGTVESIKALKQEQMEGYFARRYSPENMVLACAGRFDWDQLLQQVEELCGGWERGDAERPLSENRGQGGRSGVAKEQAVREHVCLITDAPSAQSPMRYAARLLSLIIGDDTGSRLYWSLVDTALADSADLDYESLDGTGAYFSYVSCEPSRTEKVIEIVLDCFAKIRKEGVTEQELEAAKNKTASAVTLQGEIPMGRLVPLGMGWIYLGEYLSLTEELERLRAVGRAEIMELLEAYPLTPVTTLGLGPAKMKGAG